MAYGFRFAIVTCLALALGACRAQPQVTPEPAKKVLKKTAGKAKKGEAKQPEVPKEPEKFVVPFAWEAGKDEPLALTRAFLHDVVVDNDEYMEHGEKFFAAFADKQTPRATIVTCADSRVHSPAWDSTPENDDFTIRDIGNQVENVEGSVEYGVEHLHTPLLLVIGHTGCGAVKAAMGDISKLSEPIRKELEHLKVPSAAAGKTEQAAWAEAVVANVNNQVAFSLKRFGSQVHSGELTIVGAVYDFRNDLGRGAGKLTIVNVNGNSDAERMASFVEALNARGKEAKAGKEPKSSKDGKRERTAEPSSLDIAAEMAKIRGVSAQAVAVEPAASREAAGEASAHGH